MASNDWDNASLSMLVRQAGEDASKRIRVAMPGRIVSFNGDAQTAVVQPLIKQVMADGTSRDYPLLQDVPVKFPRGGRFVLTFPVQDGDECELVFHDRCLDGWWQSGDSAEPLDYRLHDLSDATAELGLSSQPNVVKNIDMDGVVLRTLDGTASIKIDADGVVTIRGTKVVLDCPVEFTKGMKGDGDIVADGVSHAGHTHIDSMGGQTSKPQ